MRTCAPRCLPSLFNMPPHSCMGPQPGGEALRPENLSRTLSGASSLRSFTCASWDQHANQIA
jgi:hypothetical protein